MKTKMLSLLLVIFTFPYFYSQGAIGVLAQTKTSIESKVKDLADSYKTDSKSYYTLYPKYKKLYMDMLPLYDSFKGNLKQCTITEKTKSSFKSCLKDATDNFVKPLKTLDQFYAENQLIGQNYGLVGDSKSKSESKSNSKIMGMNQSSSGDPITAALLSSLIIDGTIKVWQHVDRHNQASIDAFKAEIDRNSYDLKEFKDLLPPPTYNPQ